MVRLCYLFKERRQTENVFDHPYGLQPLNESSTEVALETRLSVGEEDVNVVARWLSPSVAFRSN